MYFDDGDDSLFTHSEKTVKIYKNGQPTQFYDLKVKKDYKPTDVIRDIIENLKLENVQKFRLFTIEGVEIYPEELQYIKEGDVLFASRGEDFDKNSTLAEYEILERLGEGGFGSVFLAVHRRSKEKVAIKFLKGSAIVQAHEIDRLYSEAETLKNLHHKNIVTVLQCFSLQSMQVAFVMEYLEGGELLHYVKQRGRLTEEEAREFFTQMCDAVAYCHRQRIIHCDLKLENILLEAKDSKVVKVVDFGISGLCSNVEGGMDAGTLDYMAPEFFNDKKKNLHSGIDIWALGCILYEMVCGTPPFRIHGLNDKKKLISRICNCEYSYGDQDDKLSKEIKHLISRMLEVDISHRITVHEVLDHPWMLNQEMEGLYEEEKSTEASNSSKTSLNKKTDHKSGQATHTFPRLSIVPPQGDPRSNSKRNSNTPINAPGSPYNYSPKHSDAPALSPSHRHAGHSPSPSPGAGHTPRQSMLKPGPGTPSKGSKPKHLTTSPSKFT